jgi:hypothetical protein
VDTLVRLVRALIDRRVRFVVIGVGGANYYLPLGMAAFVTADRDFFLPPDPDNLLRCWEACEAVGLDLWGEREPLDTPRDRWLAERVIEQRALTRATDGSELDVDLTCVMQGFDFETVWSTRRAFSVNDIDIPVARLLHIVISKRAAGRDKDLLFLATYRQALEALLRAEADESKEGA